MLDAQCGEDDAGAAVDFAEVVSWHRCPRGRRQHAALRRRACYGYGYILGPSPVPPIYLSGSFGLVRPAWI